MLGSLSLSREPGKDIYVQPIDWWVHDIPIKKKIGDLWYVHKCEMVKENFGGVIHVKDTTIAYLEFCIHSPFTNFSFSLNQVRNQGYDGGSNMVGIRTVHYEIQMLYVCILL